MNRTPSKKDRLRQKWNEKDEACFGTPIDDNILEQDFDFEKNLALFNKQVRGNSFIYIYIFREREKRGKLPEKMKSPDERHTLTHGSLTKGFDNHRCLS